MATNFKAKPQKFYENVGNLLIEINDIAIEKFEGSYIEKGFEQVSKALMVKTAKLENLLNSEGYFVGELYSDQTLIYQAVNGKLIPPYLNNKKKDRDFYISIFNAVYKELSTDLYRYK